MGLQPQGAHLVLEEHLRRASMEPYEAAVNLLTVTVQTTEQIRFTSSETSTYRVGGRDFDYRSTSTWRE